MRLPLELESLSPLNIVLIIVGLVSAAAVWAILYRPRDLPYRRLKTLLTAAEQRFYKALHAAVGRDYAIFTKVRIADTMEVVRVADRRARIVAHNRIAAKHFDYVLCDPKTSNIIAAIELDDSSHQRRSRRRRDRFVDAACSKVGLPLVRYPVAHEYKASEIRHAIATAIKRRGRIQEQPGHEETRATPGAAGASPPGTVND